MSQSRLPGTPSLLRAINDRAALELLLERGPLTRAQLGELTGLSKVTASQLVERLEERRLVPRVGEQAGGRGPNAQLYAVVAEQRVRRRRRGRPAAGGRRLRRHHRRTIARVELSTHDADDPVGVVHAAVVEAADQAGAPWDRVRRVVLGTPGLVDPGNRRHLVRLRPAALAPRPARRAARRPQPAGLVRERREPGRHRRGAHRRRPRRGRLRARLDRPRRRPGRRARRPAAPRRGRRGRRDRLPARAGRPAARLHAGRQPARRQALVPADRQREDGPRPGPRARVPGRLGRPTRSPRRWPADPAARAGARRAGPAGRARRGRGLRRARPAAGGAGRRRRQRRRRGRWPSGCRTRWPGSPRSPRASSPPACPRTRCCRARCSPPSRPPARRSSPPPSAEPRSARA